jgi:hypothetical protein
LVIKAIIAALSGLVAILGKFGGRITKAGRLLLKAVIA